MGHKGQNSTGLNFNQHKEFLGVQEMNNNSNSNKRLHILFIIGSDTLPATVLGEIIGKINLKYGGSTLHKGYGSWSEDGASFNETYGNVNVETAYQIELCVMPEKFDFDYLKKCFVPARQWATWIHCEYWETTAEHFSIKEM